MMRPNGQPCGNPVPEPMVIEYHEGDDLGDHMVVGPGAGFTKEFYLCGECARRIAATTEMPKPGDIFTVGHEALTWASTAPKDRR